MVEISSGNRIFECLRLVGVLCNMELCNENISCEQHYTIKPLASVWISLFLCSFESDELITILQSILFRPRNTVDVFYLVLYWNSWRLALNEFNSLLLYQGCIYKIWVSRHQIWSRTKHLRVLGWYGSPRNFWTSHSGEAIGSTKIQSILVYARPKTTRQLTVDEISGVLPSLYKMVQHNNSSSNGIEIFLELELG